MSAKKFDDILNECLDMLQAGASVDDCVALYPDHAEELRAQLRMAQTLSDARPQVRPDPSAMARNRSRLLTATTEERQAPVPQPLFGLVLGGARRLALLPYALPVALALLFAVGGLTAAGAVLQPDVPVLRAVFGDGSTSPPLVAFPTAADPTQTPDADNDSSSGSSSGKDEPRVEFKSGDCEVRGLVTSLSPLVINGITIDDSNPEEVRGDLAQAMADGTFVDVEGTSDGEICIAREIKVQDDDDKHEEADDGEDEPRIEFGGGECEVRGLITSLSPLVINGVTIDDSGPEEIRGDLAQAMADGTFVDVEGTSDGDVCIAREIKVEDDEDDQAEPTEESRIEFEDGECEVRGLITSLSPLVINGVTIDDSDPEELRGDLAQAMADGTQVRVKGASDGDICIAREIKVEDDDDKGEDADGDEDESRVEFEGGECEVRGLITSLSPLVINGVTIDDSNPEEIRGDLAQAMADGTQVRVKGASDGGVCIAREIKVEDDDAGEQAEFTEESRVEFEGGECEVRGLITSLSPLVINGVTIDDSNPEEIRGDLAQAMADGTQVRVKGASDGGVCIAREIKVEDDE